MPIGVDHPVWAFRERRDTGRKELERLTADPERGRDAVLAMAVVDELAADHVAVDVLDAVLPQVGEGPARVAETLVLALPSYSTELRLEATYTLLEVMRQTVPFMSWPVEEHLRALDAEPDLQKRAALAPHIFADLRREADSMQALKDQLEARPDDASILVGEETVIIGDTSVDIR